MKTMNTHSVGMKRMGAVPVTAVVGLALIAALMPSASTRASDVLLASVAITASPGTLCPGQSATLSWSSTDATSLSIDQGIGSVLPFGNRTVSPASTTTYTITGTNSTGGYAVASATVYVDASCASPTPTPYPSNLHCTPSHQSANSGEYVTFTAHTDYDSQVWPQHQLTWSAVGGHPSTGTGWSFGTRFYTDSINETRVVTVSDGYRTGSCTVYVYGDYPTWTPSPYPKTLRCSASDSTVDSGERVTFTARGGDGSYHWYAADGDPSYGDDDTFRTRFYNYDWYTQHRYVTVTSGWQTATCSVQVRGDRWTPTPTPRDALRCSVNVSTVESGERVTFTAHGGDGSYHWYAADGSPSADTGSTFRTRFSNASWYAQYRTATVTSGWQTASCSVLVNAAHQPPSPTWTPYPTWIPTPTTYPYTGAGITLTQTARNVSRGQTGEYGSVTARAGDTIDFIIRVRSTDSRYLLNGFVTSMLPSGLTYLSGSTTLNGYAVGDGVTTSGIIAGTIGPVTPTVVKFSARVGSGAVPSWGTVTVYNTAQARADGVGTVSAHLPVTLGTGASINAVSSVKTGPADSFWTALLMALLVTGGYAAYTRTDVFGRRMTRAEVARLSRTSADLNFSK